MSKGHNQRRRFVSRETWESNHEATYGPRPKGSIADDFPGERPPKVTQSPRDRYKDGYDLVFGKKGKGRKRGRR
jgi:hypothetical protein